MTLVATVDGKEVHSDKRMRSINGTRIEFTDGSWCDAATGQVSNQGSGFINIGAPGSDSDGAKITKGPERFTASSLEVRQVAADLSVEVHSDPDMEVTVHGPSDVVEAIRLVVNDGTLVIEGEPSANNGGISIVSRRGNTATSGVSINVGSVVSVGDLTIGGRGENSAKITVKVPPGSPLAISGISGATNIGDTGGPLTVNVLGGNDVDIGRVGNATLSVHGSGDIRVAEVNGAVVARVHGSGDIDIENGTIAGLDVSVMGIG